MSEALNLTLRMTLQAGLQHFNRTLKWPPDKYPRKKNYKGIFNVQIWHAAKFDYFDEFGSDTKAIAAGKTQHTFVLHF